MTKQEHLLQILSEECSEIQKAISKALRFGLDDGYPEGTTTNEDDIYKELNDLNATVELLNDEGVLNYLFNRKAVNEKKVKIKKYMDYARQRATLTT
jgi:hypothetical protein